MSLVFRVRPLRFVFRAEGRIFVPPGKTENLFRGALGMALKRVGCGEECQGIEPCDSEPMCGYRRIFAPKMAHCPSGLADPPRPFVLRVARRSEGWIERGGELEIGVHLFDLDADLVRYLVVAFAQLGTAGIGPGRGRCRLVAVDQDAVRLFEHGTMAAPQLPSALEVGLDGCPEWSGRLEVEFVTPAEIKADGGVVARPEFRVLMARVRDRVASLMTIYQGTKLEMDFDGFLREAAEVRLTDSGLESTRAMRRSTRTGQSHALGGVVGRLVYEGPVGRYLPWLAAAAWTGVGRQTVWGKGQIAVQRL